VSNSSIDLNKPSIAVVVVFVAPKASSTELVIPSIPTFPVPTAVKALAKL
jgi:hypothetical protein